MKHQFADSSPGADFLATRPPRLPPDEQLAELMATLRATTIRAVIFDLDTRLCHESWQINEDGESFNDGDDGSAINQFVTAMGTIAQLSQTSATETLIRQLNPRRCAFAWRIDQGRVAVAEIRYRLPQSGRLDQDAALVREQFIARMEHQAPIEALPAVNVTPETPNPPLGAATATVHRADGMPSQPSTPHLADIPPPEATAHTVRRHSSAGLFALILFCLVAAMAFLIAGQQMQSLHDEQLRLRAQIDATMGKLLTDVLAQGDYGEVQAELQTFADLGYFQHAVVTNAQGRAIAIVGTVTDARIGNPYPPNASGTGTVMALQGSDPPGVGHLMTWAFPGSAALPLTSRRSLMVAAALLSLVALGIAAWLLARSRRRSSLPADAAFPRAPFGDTPRTPS